MVEIASLNKLKRKHTSSPEAQVVPLLQTSKKQRYDGQHDPRIQSASTRLPAKPEVEQSMKGRSVPESAVIASSEQAYTNGGAISPANTAFSSSAKSHPQYAPEIPAKPPMDTPMQDAEPATSVDPTGLTPLQQAIESQFNMQILMKHNELRLIEQELGKCQIALEQLRRCELRPYPGSKNLSEAVSAGVGPSLAPKDGYSRPSHPAPYGVADGPFTRHYRQWLLPDPAFDSVPLQSPYSAESNAQAAGRGTRNSHSVRKSVSKPFATPGRPTETLASIPNYPSAPPKKEKGGPLILRRSTDNQLVKLVCNNCNRGDMSSIQGFLNHCRIAHKVDYKSHDSAAVDCGRPLEPHEAANVSVEAHPPIVHKPTPSRSASLAVPVKNMVHPLNNTSAQPIEAKMSQQRPSVASVPARSLSCAAPAGANASPLKPSTQMPRLSALFAKNNMGGDLQQAAANAKQKVDLSAEDDALSPDLSSPNSPSETASAGRAGMLATPGGFTRPPSRKGHRQPTTQRPRPSPLAPTNAAHARLPSKEHHEVPESPQDHSSFLSPNTADGNPGLVSDVEDDDNGSVSEGEASHPEISRPLTVARDCTDNMEIDVAVHDDMDEHGVVIRRNSMMAAEERGIRTAGSPSRKLGMGKR